MEGTMRTYTSQGNIARPRRWTDSEWLVVGCAAMACMALVAIAYVACNPAVDAGALAGVGR